MKIKEGSPQFSIAPRIVVNQMLHFKKSLKFKINNKSDSHIQHKCFHSVVSLLSVFYVMES